jgi:hypothetical protein
MTTKTEVAANEIDPLVAMLLNMEIDDTPADQTEGVSDETLQAVETKIEMADGYAAQPADETASVDDAPTTGDAEAEAAAEATLKEKKAAAKAEKEAAKAAKKAEREAAKAAKAEGKPKRVYFGNKTERVKANVSADNLILEISDAALEGDALAEKQADTIKLIDAMAIKSKGRATLLLEYVTGKSATLNKVIATAFTVLSESGKIVTGDKGNLHDVLISKGYQPSAARAMARSTLVMLRTLKVLQGNGEAQTFVGNPNSTLLAAVNGKLGLS